MLRPVLKFPPYTGIDAALKSLRALWLGMTKRTRIVLATGMGGCCNPIEFTDPIESATIARSIDAGA